MKTIPYKDIDLSTFVPVGSKIDIYNSIISDKLINTDSKIEFLLPVKDNAYKINWLLINKNGDKVFDLHQEVEAIYYISFH